MIRNHRKYRPLEPQTDQPHKFLTSPILSPGVRAGGEGSVCLRMVLSVLLRRRFSM